MNAHQFRKLICDEEQHAVMRGDYTRADLLSEIDSECFDVSIEDGDVLDVAWAFPEEESRQRVRDALRGYPYPGT